MTKNVKTPELEIIEYIESSEFDEKIKNFIIQALYYEKRNKDVMRYADKYEMMIDDALGDM